MMSKTNTVIFFLKEETTVKKNIDISFKPEKLSNGLLGRE